MKTHVFQKLRFYTIAVSFLTVSFCLEKALALPIQVQLNEKPVSSYEDSRVYIQLSDSLTLKVKKNKENSNLRWIKLVPQAKDYDNYQYCREKIRSGCVQPIEYKPTEIIALRGRSEFDWSESTELYQEGTHLIQVVDAKNFKTEVFQTTEKPEALEIVVRRDNTYIGYLTELIGVPFVFYPNRIKLKQHQTDLRLGADCIATVIYGQRRLGRRFPYMAPKALKRFTQKVKQGKVKKGDILHFGFQTAVFVKDYPPIGKVSDNDTVIHSYHEKVEEVEFGRLPYKKLNFEVRRWK